MIELWCSLVTGATVVQLSCISLLSYARTGCKRIEWWKVGFCRRQIIQSFPHTRRSVDPNRIPVEIEYEPVSAKQGVGGWSGDAPFDIEARDPRLLGENTSNEGVYVFARVRCDNALGGSSFLLRRVVARLELWVAVLSVDIVADPNKLLLRVGAREKDDGDADQIARRDAGGQWGGSLDGGDG